MPSRRRLLAVVLSVVAHGGMVLAVTRLPADHRSASRAAMLVEVRPLLATRAVRSSGTSMPAREPEPRPPGSPAPPHRPSRKGPGPATPPVPGARETPRSPSPRPVTADLFAASAIEHAAGLAGSDGAAASPGAPAARGYVPHAGVGREPRGGLDMGSFLVEDAARNRASQGVVPPRLREVERTVRDRFQPPYGHVDVSNKLQLLHKEMMARLRTPPRVRALSRAEDPARETNDQKLENIVREPFFLGRFAEVFARQAADGGIVELLVRTSSGFRSFDEDALDAVRAALERTPVEGAGDGREVRSLWRLEATAYVVYSATPTGEFDEATGKVKFYYPLQKRVDHKVKLVAVY